MIPEAVTEFKQRKGDWILLPSGTEFYVLDPRAEEIHISDIAHNLANNCRFHGPAASITRWQNPAIQDSSSRLEDGKIVRTVHVYCSLAASIRLPNARLRDVVAQ